MTEQKTEQKIKWIADFICIKEAGLDFAYCRGDIESAHKIEEDIKSLRAMAEKKLQKPPRRLSGVKVR